LSHDPTPVLGIDVGGVLIERADEDDDTSFFGSHPMDTPAVEGAFTALAALCAGPFAFRVHIVSKAGPKIAALTHEWLETKRFFAETGVSTANIWFVRRREEKHDVCRRLGITHFVDDRVDVLTTLATVAHRYLFTGGLGTDPPPSDVPGDIEVHATWAELARAIRSTIPE
jgi:hypothetical protein